MSGDKKAPVPPKGRVVLSGRSLFVEFTDDGEVTEFRAHGSIIVVGNGNTVTRTLDEHYVARRAPVLPAPAVAPVVAAPPVVAPAPPTPRRRRRRSKR